MSKRSDVLFELAHYLLTPAFGVTIAGAFQMLNKYPEIGKVVRILNGKCKKEEKFGTELWAKIKSEPSKYP